MTKPTILYFYTTWSPFVDNDTDSLKSKYNVKSFLFEPKRKINILYSLISQLFFLLANVTGSKLIVVMFAGHHSLLPALVGKIFGKPCLIISGGTDCVSFPSINYGNFKGGLIKITTR